jgi:hypothetical protein
MCIIDASMADAALKKGAVGIGERHDDQVGRTLARQLIKQGVVKHLFVEAIGNLVGYQLDLAAEVRGKGWEAVRKCLDLRENNNSMKVADVVADAIVAGVAVHFADHHYANYTKGQSKSGMTTRNETVAKTFKDATGAKKADDPGAVGSLILFGGDHFKDPSPISELIPGLPWVKACL